MIVSVAVLSYTLMGDEAPVSLISQYGRYIDHSYLKQHHQVHVFILE